MSRASPHDTAHTRPHRSRRRVAHTIASATAISGLATLAARGLLHVEFPHELIITFGRTTRSTAQRIDRLPPGVTRRSGIRSTQRLRTFLGLVDSVTQVQRCVQLGRSDGQEGWPSRWCIDRVGFLSLSGLIGWQMGFRPQAFPPTQNVGCLV